MNDGRAPLARCHHPLKADRVILSHRRSHDENGIGVRQVGLCGSRAAAPQRCAQTGHGRAMSYPGLVADANHAQTPTEKFLDQIVFFIIQSRAAQVSDGFGVHQLLAILFFHKRSLPALPHDDPPPYPWPFRGRSPPIWSRMAAGISPWSAFRDGYATRRYPRPSGRDVRVRSASQDRLRLKPAHHSGERPFVHTRHRSKDRSTG